SNVVQRGGMACEAVVRRRIVVLHLMANAADKRHLVHDLGHAREAFANGNARRFALNRPKLTPNLVGGVGLHVERIGLTGSAELMEKDDRLGASLWFAGFPGLQKRG